MNKEQAAEVLRDLNDNYFANEFDDANEALEIAIQELSKPDD